MPSEEFRPSAHLVKVDFARASGKAFALVPNEFSFLKDRRGC